LDKNKITYTSYLKLNQLLNLQELQSYTEHDEMLFIIIHQAYELWFKQIIYELDYLKKNITENQIYIILRTLKRIKYILKLLISKMDVLATMAASNFKNFRNYLGTASGFQSYQFRELEILLGIEKTEAQLNAFPLGSNERNKIEERNKAKKIWDYFLDFFQKNILNNNDISQTCPISEEEILLAIYEKASIYTTIADLILDIDEGLQEWRYRHLKIVERMIGDITAGTGGSAGVAYLQNSIKQSFCPNLWKIKNKLATN